LFSERSAKMPDEFDPAVAMSMALNCFREGRPSAAEAILGRIIDAQPENAEALHLLGIIALQTGRGQQAIGFLATAVDLAPANPHFVNTLGVAYKASNRISDAAACHRRALALDAGHAEAHCNLGDALEAEGMAEEAAACYRRAIAVNPNLLAAHFNLGNLLAARRDAEAAMACYRQALRIDPDVAYLHSNLGNALRDQGRTTEAMACYRRAREIDPGYGTAHFNLAILLEDQKQHAEAIACYRRVLEIDPAHGPAAAHLLHQLRTICEWGDIGALAGKVDEMTETAIRRGGKPGETPFMNVTRRADPANNLAVARSWTMKTGKPSDTPHIHATPRKARKRLTIGYMSGDYLDHVSNYMIAGVFRLHDRRDFRIVAYSNGPDDGSPHRRRTERACDALVDIRNLDAGAAAGRIVDDEIDVLVDLSGHTNRNRLDILALRPAPVLATYKGFPGTTGAPFIDYIITDGIVTPPDQAPHFSEKFVVMPHCYQANDYRHPPSEKRFTRAELGLPEGALVFCCFNFAFKIEPVMFALWMDLLKAVPAAVLWLMGDNPPAAENLRRKAAARGVDADRLVFAPRLLRDQHLVRIGHADLALDTRICCGHATSADTLWAGVPLVALHGSHFASRVSESLLAAVGLGEMAVDGLDAYHDLVLALASDPARLRALREKLAQNRLTEPLFDTSRFVRNLEKAYKLMWEVFQAGELPRHLVVTEKL
jgi:protein O-GlcNAc transferase